MHPLLPAQQQNSTTTLLLINMKFFFFLCPPGQSLLWSTMIGRYRKAITSVQRFACCRMTKWTSSLIWQEKSGCKTTTCSPLKTVMLIVASDRNKELTMSGKWPHRLHFLSHSLTELWNYWQQHSRLWMTSLVQDVRLLCNGMKQTRSIHHYLCCCFI